MSPCTTVASAFPANGRVSENWRTLNCIVRNVFLDGSNGRWHCPRQWRRQTSRRNIRTVFSPLHCPKLRKRSRSKSTCKLTNSQTFNGKKKHMQTTLEKQNTNGRATRQEYVAPN